MKKILVSFIAIMSLTHGYSQKMSPTSEASFIYNFTRYVEWEQKDGIFNVVVLGSEEVFFALNDYCKYKKIGNRPMRVVRALNSEDVFKADIIFVSKDKNSSLGSLVEKFAEKNVLLVTESDGATEGGASINFLLVDGKLKFEASRKNIAKQNLKISSDFEKIAIMK